MAPLSWEVSCLVLVLTLVQRVSADSPEGQFYSYGVTSAWLDEDDDGQMVDCRLFLDSPEDRARHPEDAAFLSRERHQPEQQSFASMLAIVQSCRNVALTNETRVRGGKNASWSAWSLLRGILPGTKWCGVNDAATRFDDLGYFKEVDACCREHDHCPIRIPGLKKRFGVRNPSIMTISHCECDALFHECLKDIEGSPEADSVGNLYFEGLRGKCVATRLKNRCLGKSAECTQDNKIDQTDRFVLVNSRKRW